MAPAGEADPPRGAGALHLRRRLRGIRGRSARPDRCRVRSRPLRVRPGSDGDVRKRNPADLPGRHRRRRTDRLRAGLCRRTRWPRETAGRGPRALKRTGVPTLSFALALLAVVACGDRKTAAPKVTPTRGNEAERRARMVETQLVARGVRDPRVVAALREVPGHLFVDPSHRPRAYEDHPLPIAGNQTISQP